MTTHHPTASACDCGGSGYTPGTPEDEPCPYHAAAPQEPQRFPFLIWTHFPDDDPQAATVWAVDERAAIAAIDVATYYRAEVWHTDPQELRQILSDHARSTEAGSDQARAIDLDDQDHAAAVLAILRGQEDPE